MADTLGDTKHDIESPSFRDLKKSSPAGSRKGSNDLIASDRVEGTKVYRPDGEKIGKVHHFMVSKQSGKVEYAVLSFGGFLGMGEEFRPLPWDALDYDTELGGYVVSAEEDTFRNSPNYTSDREPNWDRDYAVEVYGYWGVPYF